MFFRCPGKVTPPPHPVRRTKSAQTESRRCLIDSWEDGRGRKFQPTNLSRVLTTASPQRRPPSRKRTHRNSTIIRKGHFLQKKIIISTYVYFFRAFLLMVDTGCMFFSKRGESLLASNEGRRSMSTLNTGSKSERDNFFANQL